VLKYLKYLSLIATLFITPVLADSVLVIDAQYDQVTNNVKGRLEAAGHTVTVTTDISLNLLSMVTSIQNTQLNLDKVDKRG